MGHPRHDWLGSYHPPRSIAARINRNTDYKLWGSRYEHVEVWRAHHGVVLDPETYIIHHINEDKHDNRVCARDDGRCPDWSCGNLGALTRREHILQHRPGRMGGRKIPNKAGRQRYYCVDCGNEKPSRRGDRCMGCYRVYANALAS